VEINKILDKAMPGIAIELAGELKIKTPADTGRLRNSIKIKSNKNGLVITMANYGKFVEFGCFFDDKVKIKTINGIKKLKNLKTGDLIWTGFNYKKLIQKEKLEIGYKIKKIIIYVKGEKLELTEDHPIFTQKGWKKAIELNKKDKVYFIK